MRKIRQVIIIMVIAVIIIVIIIVRHWKVYRLVPSYQPAYHYMTLSIRQSNAMPRWISNVHSGNSITFPCSHLSTMQHVYHARVLLTLPRSITSTETPVFVKSTRLTKRIRSLIIMIIMMMIVKVIVRTVKTVVRRVRQWEMWRLVRFVPMAPVCRVSYNLLICPWCNHERSWSGASSTPPPYRRKMWCTSSWWRRR